MSSRISALYASIVLDTSTLSGASGKVRSAMSMVRDALKKTQTPVEMLEQDLEKLKIAMEKNKITAEEEARILEFLDKKYDVHGEHAREAARLAEEERLAKQRLLDQEKQLARETKRLAEEAKQKLAEEQKQIDAMKKQVASAMPKISREEELLRAMAASDVLRRKGTISVAEHADMNRKLNAELTKEIELQAQLAQKKQKAIADAKALEEAQKRAKLVSTIERALPKEEITRREQLLRALAAIDVIRMREGKLLAEQAAQERILVAELNKEIEAQRMLLPEYQRTTRAKAFALERVRDLNNANRQLRHEQAMLGRAFREGTINATQYAAAMRRVAIDSLSAKLESIGLSRGLQSAATAFFSFQTAKSIIQSAAEFEQLSITMRVLIGDAKVAGKVFAEVNELVESTPVTMKSAMDSSRTLLAFGVEAESLAETLEILGNVSAGNEERFQGLALAFAQTQAAGRLTGQEVLQMVNQGFNPLKQMAEDASRMFGISAPAAFKKLKIAMEQGAISADMVTDAFRSASTGTGKYAGLLAATTETMSGQFAIFQSNLFALKAAMGGAFESIIVTFLTVINKIISAVVAINRLIPHQIKQWMGWLAAITAVVLIAPRIIAAIKAISMAIWTLTGAQAAFVAVSSPGGFARLAKTFSLIAVAAGVATAATSSLSDKVASVDSKISKPGAEYKSGLEQLMESNKQSITLEESAQTLIELTQQLANLGKTQNEIDAERLQTATETYKVRRKELADQLQALTGGKDPSQVGGWWKKDAERTKASIDKLDADQQALKLSVEQTIEARKQLEIKKQQLAFEEEAKSMLDDYNNYKLTELELDKQRYDLALKNKVIDQATYNNLLLRAREEERLTKFQGDYLARREEQANFGKTELEIYKEQLDAAEKQGVVNAKQKSDYIAQFQAVEKIHNYKKPLADLEKQIADYGKSASLLEKERIIEMMKRNEITAAEAQHYIDQLDTLKNLNEQQELSNFHAQRHKDSLQSTVDLAIARAANSITELEYQERLAAIEDKRLQTTKQLAEQGQAIEERYNPVLAVERQLADLQVLLQTASIDINTYVLEQNRILSEAAAAKFEGMQQPSAMEFGSKEAADMMQQGAFDAQKQQLIEMEKQRLLQQAQLGAQQEANKLLNNIQTIGVARP